MSGKVGLSLVLAATMAASVCVPVAIADDTGVASSLHALRREGGRVCMTDHWHYGSSGVQSTKKRAQMDAIRSWADFTAFEYGTDWARWYRARSRKVSCSRASGGYRCDVEARPCK